LQQQLLIGSSSSNRRSRANINVIKWYHKQHNLNTFASVYPHCSIACSSCLARFEVFAVPIRKVLCVSCFLQDDCPRPEQQQTYETNPGYKAPNSYGSEV
jgi:hypothetical protein